MATPAWSFQALEETFQALGERTWKATTSLPSRKIFLGADPAITPPSEPRLGSTPKPCRPLTELKGQQSGKPSRTNSENGKSRKSRPDRRKKKKKHKLSNNLEVSSNSHKKNRRKKTIPHVDLPGDHPPQTNSKSMLPIQNSQPAPPSPVFRLLDLPIEIRCMIYKFIFDLKPNKKSKFLRVVEGSRAVYVEAFRVFCMVNNFMIPLRQSERLRLQYASWGGVERLPVEYMKLVRSFTIKIPDSIVYIAPFRSPLLAHARITNLTLSSSSMGNLITASRSIIPSFPHLDTLSIALEISLPLWLSFEQAYEGKFSKVLRIVDKLVGVKGRYVTKREDLMERRTRGTWAWKAEELIAGERRFVLNLPRE